jgi:FkbH-like protein
VSNEGSESLKTLIDLVSHQAERRSEGIAYRFLVDGEVEGKVREMSFRKLEVRARAIAAWLQQQGASGQRAILLYPPGLEFIEAYFGCLLAGVVSVPAFPPSTTQGQRTLPRLRAIVTNARAALMLTSRSIAGVVESMTAQAADLSSLTRGITDEIPDQLAPLWFAPIVDGSSIAFLQYTSGSTSTPKGVVVSHSNLLANAASMAKAMGYGVPRPPSWDGDLVSWLPLQHDMGLIGTVILGLWVGRTSTLLSPMHFLRKPLRWLKAISRHRARTSGAPNFAYDLCARRAAGGSLEGLDLSSWEVAFNGAEPVRWETMQRFARAFAPCGFRLEAFGPCYGLAESTLMVSGAFGLEPPKATVVAESDPPAPGSREPFDFSEVRSAVSCGRAGDGTSFKIVDARQRIECREGEVGEVWVSGSSVAQGYWDDPETTATVFAATLEGGGREAYLRTGDLGFVQGDELYVTGRLKDLLIIDGRNHYPQDIEATVEAAHPSVRESCVAAFSIEGAADVAGELAVVVAEARGGTDVERDAIKVAIRRAVSDAHGLALHEVVLVRSHTILKTSSGKIQRSACRRALLDGQLELLGKGGDGIAVPPFPPSEPLPAPSGQGLRTWLVQAVASRARLDPAQVDLDRPLTEMGLGSRALVELTGQLAERLGRDLPATILFEYPTIARVLQHLEGEGAHGGRRPSSRQERRSGPDEPIAIVALAGRFPGDVDEPEALWHLLATGRDAVGPFPPERWDVESLYDPDPEAVGKSYARAGGFICGIDRFDPAFFGISPREAASMDPQQRLLLQTSWEALERAGIVPASLEQSETGVYIGMFESAYLASGGLGHLDGYVGTGCSPSVASGRLAYTLGLHGPALTVDTACSSSLVALHLACQALRDGECNLALAGGVTLMPTPRTFVEFSRLRGLSPSGRCRPFSEDAEGVGWAEGCAVVVLKPLSEARREGDPILAVIRGTAVNQDGRSQGLTAPSGPAQAQVIRRALELSELSPADIDYVEAHGTGTRLGDPIEARALVDVFGGGRPMDRPLYLGSLKSNIAHAQAAAGIGSLMKVVLSLIHQELPKTLHVQTPTAQVDWVGSGLALVTEARPWPRGARVRRAGVSSFGLSGTNAHVIVEEAPLPSSPAVEPPRAAPDGLPGEMLLFPVSGRTDAAVQVQASRLRAHLEASPSLALADVARTLAVGRTHFQRRTAIVARDRDELLSALGLLERGAPSPRAALPPPRGMASGKVAFVFPGQGAQWVGMGARLLTRSPTFARAIERCDSALRPHTGWSVLALLGGAPGAPEPERIDVVQPALFSMMVALTELWRSLGIEPDAVVGHSQGEVAAAWAAGALTIEDAAKIVAVRSRALVQMVGLGAMAAVELPSSEVERRLDQSWPRRLAVAAQNSARSTVVSGDPEALEAFLSTLRADEVFARKIRVDVASHSPQMEVLRHEILQGLAGVEGQAGSVPLYSTVLGQKTAGDALDAEYWYRNLRQPVGFADAIAGLLADGFRFFVEVSPHPLLQLAIESAAEDQQVPVVTVGSLRRDEDCAENMALSLAGLHAGGYALDWSRVTPAGRRVPLPTYAFETQRHWLEQHRPIDGPGLVRTEHPLLGAGLQSAGSLGHTFVNDLSRRSPWWLSDHVVFGEVVLSGTTILELCRAALVEAYAGEPFDVAELLLVAPLPVPEQGWVQVQVEVSASSGGVDLQVHSRVRAEGEGWTLHATARGVSVRPASEQALERMAAGAPVWPSAEAERWSTDLCDRLAAAGLVHGPGFRGVTSVVRASDDRILARVSLPGALEDEASRYGMHPALLDAALQAAAVMVGTDDVLLPVAIERWSLWRLGAGALIVQVERTESTADGCRLGVSLWDTEGAPVGRLEGVTLRRADRAQLRRSCSGRDLYEVRWHSILYERINSRAGVCAIIADEGDQALQLAPLLFRALETAGVEVVRLSPASAIPAHVETLIKLWPCDEPRSVPDAAQALAIQALGEVQAALSSSSRPVATIWVTCGAVASAPLEGVARLWQSPLWGLARTVRAEHPELGLRAVDLNWDGRGPLDLALVMAALFHTHEPELAIRGTELRAPRLVQADDRGTGGDRLNVPPGRDFRLEIGEPGRLDRLQLCAADARALGPGEVRIGVRAAGLNFRDVLKTIDVRPHELAAMGSWDTPLGSECAGVIVECGEQVEGLAIGQRVMALAVGALASEVVADARLTVAIPAGMSFAEAATVPVAFATAYYGLRDLAGIRRGEKLLVHAAAGGVGMAAVQLARLWGVEVFATASEPKWPALEGLGVPRSHIANSRALDFADEFRASAGDRPVDVILNSLAREYVDASLALLGPGGRFLELGKTDVRDPEVIAGAHCGVTYRAYDLGQAGPRRLSEILREVVRHLELGELSPIRQQRFPIHDAGEAFRTMAQGRHVGKVVLEMVGARPVVPKSGTVLVTGGLGSLGLSTARWLAESGATRLVLASRQGAGHPRATEAMASLAALGVEVEVVACDVADRASLARLLSSLPPAAPLSGVVHCAGELDDGVVREQSADRLGRVMRSKVWGAWHLHELTAGLPLELFLLYSSAAGVVGAPGQCTYAAANVFLDQLAHARRARGLAAVSLSYGAWSGGGLAVEHADLGRMASQGFGALSPGRALGLLQRALERGLPHQVPWKLTVSRLQKALARDGAVPALWRVLVKPPQAPAPERAGLGQSLARLSVAERHQRLVALVREEAAQVLRLGSPNEVPADQPLRQLGLDSLMAVELRNRLSAHLGRPLPATLLFDHATPAALVRHLLQSVLSLGSGVVSTPVVLPRPTADEPIAIVAMSCRFPGGADTPEGLWRMLAEGRQAIEVFPAGRWDVEALYDADPEAAGKTYVRSGAFLPRIDGFDAGFFGIAPREARSMDPQQRLLLQTAWEALERAGILPAALNDSSTGVYLGMFESGYSSASSLEQLDGYIATGSFLSVASGRLAYTLGLKGPAMTVDTACSSSLVALHLACQALRARECDLALTGGVTLMATPRAFVEFSRLRGMSPSGCCKSFSEEADGVGWGEGCGVVVLKRLSDAQREGDRVLAVVRGTAVNQDGRSQGLTAPNGPAQAQVIRRAIELSGLNPADIDYVEAHGTGTRLGDPIEAGALAEVFGSSRSPERPLYLGSLKSNMAHAQAAAGVGGLLKVVLSLLHEELPRTLHAEKPTSQIQWARSGMTLLKEPRPWPKGDRVRRAGVSAFGISGTNAHVIVEEAPPPNPPAIEDVPEDGLRAGPLLFPVSGRTDEAMRAQAERLAWHVESRPQAQLLDVSFTLATGRTHFDRRAVIVASDREELLSRLRSVASQSPSAGAMLSPSPGTTSGKLAFVFPGQGSQWVGMGARMLERSKVFASALARCDSALRPYTGWSVVSLLRGEPEALEFDRTDVVQPALFSVMVSLAELWRSLGIEPDAVVGHSQGEVAAAHVSGALSLEDAARIVALRSRALMKVAGRGAMGVLELPSDEVKVRLRRDWGGLLAVAGRNSVRSTVVSGHPAAVDGFLKAMSDEGVFARRIRIDYASHSQQMEAIRDEIQEGLACVQPRASAVPFYSTVLGQPVDGATLGAGYWYRNLREPVQFADGIERLVADGFRFFVEVSAHPVLVAAVEATAEAAGFPAVTVGSLRRQDDSDTSVHLSLARLHAGGRDLDWSKLSSGGSLIELPTYPFEEQRYWFSPAAPARSRADAGPFLHRHVEASDDPGRHVFEADLDLAQAEYGYLEDHRVGSNIWLPGAALLEMVLEAARRLDPAVAWSLEEVAFLRPLELSSSRPVRLQLVIRPEATGGLHFIISSRAAADESGSWAVNVTGQLSHESAFPQTGAGAIAPLQKRCSRTVSAEVFYERLAEAGLHYGPRFRGVEAGWSGDREAVAKIAPPPRSSHVVHPAALDAAFQTAALAAQWPAGRTFVPAALGRLQVVGSGAPGWAICRVQSLASDAAVLDVELVAADGTLLVAAHGLRFVAIDLGDRNSVLEVRWKSRALGASTATGGPWLILSDRAGVGAALAEGCGRDHRVVTVHTDSDAREEAGHRWLDPADRGQLTSLLATAFGTEPPQVIVHLWSLDAPSIDSAASLAEAQRLTCTSTLHLVQAVAAMGWATQPRLFLVTRGAQAVLRSEDVVHPEQALLWGFGATLALEHPELTPTLVDLEDGGDASTLWVELTHANDEPRVAWRGGSRLVPRLEKHRPSAAELALPGPERLHPAKTYLITGGLGGLGMVVAESLLELGAIHVALLGRRPPPEAVQENIRRLEALGGKVHVIIADVTDRERLQRELATLRESAPPLGGVVHAAGVLDDATVLQLSSERMTKVLSAKVLGTAVLAALAPELDFFVLFSSVAGLVGSAGQAAYAAANAYQDAWAHHGVRLHRPALSLNWGAWAEVGMAAASEVRRRNIEGLGLRLLPPGEGSLLFRRLLRSSRPQLAPVALDGLGFARLAASMPLFQELGDGPPPPVAGVAAMVAGFRVAATLEERRPLLEEYVRSAVIRVAGGELDVRPTTPLKELGLDSLMLLQLAKLVSGELSVELSASTVLSLPTVETLAAHLCEVLGEGGDRPRPAPRVAGLPAPAVEQVERLPAPRDVVRLLRTEQNGTPSSAHHIGLAVRLGRTVRPLELERFLAGLVNRHAALRTGIIHDRELGHVLEVRSALRRPVLRSARLNGECGPREEIERRFSQLMEPPFVLAEPPLWRFELLEGASGDQVLLVGAHHAVSDAQSLVLVIKELGEDLHGRPHPRAVSNRDIHALLEAQRSADRMASLEATGSWRAAFAGCKRLELTLASPRPALPTFRAGTLCLPLPDGLLDRLSTEANRLAATTAAFCLGVLTALLARVSGQSRFVVAVPVDTRAHASVPDAVGFFGVPVPLPMEALPDAAISTIIERTTRTLDRVLQQGAAFADALPALVAEGLAREGAPLVEVYFNYIRPHAADVQHLEILDVGSGRFDVDLMVTVSASGYVRLDFHRDILDEATCGELASAYVELMDRVAGGLAGGATRTVSEISLPESLGRAAPATTERTLALAATFSLGPLSLLLETASREAGQPMVIAETPYHQVLASLLDPREVFARPETDASVVLLRAADLVRFRALGDAELAELGDEYHEALLNLSVRTRTPVLLGFLPSQSTDPRLAEWETRLAGRLAGRSRVIVLGPEEWTRRYPVGERFAPETDALGHLPFRPSFLAAVALTLTRTLHALRRAPPKVVAVDGDDTLWGGIAEEIGPESVDLSGTRAAFARKLLEWRAAGVLLVLVSNNGEETLRRVLARAESLLRVEHFVAICAGWDPKAARLRRCARSLGLGLDSFLFLDDNPVEIAAVRSELPEVLAVTVPGPGELEAFLDNVWSIDRRAVTREDRMRADLYREEVGRLALRREVVDFQCFLDRLQLEIEMRPLDDTTVERCAQLSARTNQFNLRGSRLDEVTLVRLHADADCRVWTASVRDRFGDYGQVGVLVLRASGEALQVVHWFLSCRVLGRGVEERLLRWLADQAEELGCATVSLTAEYTPRNVPARRLVAALGGGDVQSRRLEVVASVAQLRAFRVLSRGEDPDVLSADPDPSRGVA